MDATALIPERRRADASIHLCLPELKQGDVANGNQLVSTAAIRAEEMEA